jgi:hypothetical protein
MTSLRPSLLVLLIGLGILPGAATTDPVELTGDEILARLENETNRRHLLLKEYSSSRQYTLQNLRFGKQAATSVAMKFSQPEGERYTVVARSGSDRLNGIIDKILASEAVASVPPENGQHDITAANYRVRLGGIDATGGRRCYILTLIPRARQRYLIAGKVWVDAATYGVVRLEGQFAASISLLVGAPRITEEFVEVHGFWLPGHVRSVTSSLLLGPTQLEIQFSNYQVEPAGVPAN